MPAAPPIVPPPAVRRPAPPPGAPSALDLIDEAALRLRLAPSGTLGVYYAGTLPFILALLYFWTDMGRNADAPRDAPGAALGMAALFLGMKTAHAVFAARLRAQFARRAAAPWTWTRLGRVAFVQSLLQPAGLFVLSAPSILPVLLVGSRTDLGAQLFALAVGAVLTLPLGWVYAFFANVTVLGGGEQTMSARAVCVRAARHALRDPKGNHLALFIVTLLGMFAWLNLLIATLLLPQLAKIFTGEENVFTRSGLHIFNSTFFAVTFALVYLALDPLIKTFYALRCFYSDARTTGEDLTSGLRALPAPGAALAVSLALFFAAASSVSAATPRGTPTPPPAATVDSVSANALGRSVEDVLRRREFAWRSPRPDARPEAGEAGPVGRFIDGMKAWISQAWQSVGHVFHAIREWLRRWWQTDPDPSEPESAPRGGLDPETLRWLIYGLIALVAGALTLLVWRSWQVRRAGALAGTPLPAAPAPTPDLADETLLASQLPEDEWLRLAHELLARGERRLALRAFYLSTLAGLGMRGLLAVARHKSNRDYLRELRRRARDRAAVPEAFARNVGRFERVWYGPHPADDGLLADFQADRDRILAG